MEYMTSIAQLLCLSVEGEIQQAKSLSEVEQEIRRQMMEAGRQALETYLKKQRPKYPAEKTTCQHCGQEADYVRIRTAQLHTMLGVVCYERPYYLCRHCHRGTCPLDEALGLRPNQMSAELERLGGMTGVETSFGKGSQLFEALTMVCLSNQSLDKAAQAYGREMERVEQAWQQEAHDPEKLAQRKREKRKPLRLYGSLDAAKVHIREDKEHPWRDLKVGAWFEARGRPPRQPDGEWHIRAENITYFTDICPANEFTNLFWATGVQRNANLAQELVILGDGAEWIWNLVAENFPDAIQIVDWFHACEYLTPVAKAAFKDTQKQAAWVEKVKTDLWHGRVEAVIVACEACLNPDREDDPAQKAVTYFHNNQDRMNYATYRQNGYQIGSGTIESAAKQIGLLRMKVPGAIWNLDGARYVAKARAAYLSDQWAFLAQRRSHLPLAV
jgi:ribosomal protein S14